MIDSKRNDAREDSHDDALLHILQMRKQPRRHILAPRQNPRREDADVRFRDAKAPDGTHVEQKVEEADVRDGCRCKPPVLAAIDDRLVADSHILIRKAPFLRPVRKTVDL